MRLFRKYKHWIYFVAIGGCFLVGVFGFLEAGEKLTDSLYYSAQLFGMEMGDQEINAKLEFARWCSPMVLVSGILMALQGVFKLIGDWWKSLHHDATIFYGVEKYEDVLEENFKHPIFLKNAIPSKIKHHVLMFPTDEENFTFYQENLTRWKKKTVYMKLDQVDSFLLPADKIKYFYINEIIARLYWKERHLMPYLKEGKMKARIGIVGFDQLAQNLLVYALINNIYALEQEVEYHIWGDTRLFQNLFKDLELMNGDLLVFHDGDWIDDIAQFARIDRVIITEGDKLELIQSLLYCNPGIVIDYYSPEPMNLEERFGDHRVNVFGTMTKILTEENIMSDTLYDAAMEVNYAYECLYGAKEEKGKAREAAKLACWNALDGFTKGSNIASADYHEIRKMILKANPLSMDELCEMEHIRWCRYHFMNHWHYGIPENGGNKDKVQRIHKDLVPYHTLSQEEKDKDLHTVQLMMRGEL